MAESCDSLEWGLWRQLPLFKSWPHTCFVNFGKLFNECVLLLHLKYGDNSIYFMGYYKD